MLDRILVPLDGSEFGEQGVTVARTLVRQVGGPSDLHLVHAHVSTPVYLEGIATVNPDFETDREDVEREYVATVARNVKDHWPGGSVHWKLLHGPVDEAIEGYASDQEVGLIVMSSHGRGGLSRVWLGSVADRLVRRSHRPILVFRPSGEGEPTWSSELRRILVPLDGSGLSERILPHAEDLAEKTGARLLLLRVIPPYFVVGDPGLAGALEDQEEALAELEQEAGAYIEEKTSALRRRGFEVEGETLSDVASATGVLQVAEREEADLIAMATVGRGGFSRAVMGSVADKVVRGAGCPVLVLHPRDEEEG